VLLLTEQAGGWTTIGEVDTESAPWMVHPEAVYLHEAETYLVEELDLDEHLARLRPLPVDYYTIPKTETTVELVSLLDRSETNGGSKFYGELLVRSQVKGFRKVKWFTHEQLGQGDLSLPPTELQTTGYWLSLSEATVEGLREAGLWRNDPNQYGPNWREQRDRARERDGFRCQVCGIEENGGAHHVHHKIPFRSFASFEQANQLHNLVTLCPSCHHRAETVIKMRTGLSGLAYTLGNLAPLFLMCDSRDFGVHSDPQSPLDEGKPVVVLYDLIPAGIGFSQRLFELHDELVLRAFELVSNCECTDGCPSCVGPAGENGTGGKKETMAILEKLI
jgi:DEAD/DEAH box helicase domain-containing protein